MNHTAAAAVRRLRLSRTVFASLIAAVGAVTILGCDDVGDQKAFALQEQAAALRTNGLSAEGMKDADKALAEVDGASNVSPAVVQGQHAYGEFLTAQADADAAALATEQLQATQTVNRIAALLRAADAGRARSELARAMDPAERVTAANTFVTNVRGGNTPTFTALGGDNSPQLSTLTAAQQEKSRLDGEIAKLKDQIASQIKQRDDLLTQAGQVSAAMEGQNSADRVKSATQAGGLRQQAAVLARQISEGNNQLARLEADQALQAALAEQLNTGIESTQAQAKSLQEGWTTLAGTAEKQAADAKALIDGAGTAEKPTVAFLINGGGSGDDAVVGLAKQLDQLREQREKVVGTYEKAIASLDKAKNNAGTIVGELTTAKNSGGERFEGKAWEQLISTLGVGKIILSKAEAQLALADVKAQQVQLLNDLLVTAKTYDQVGTGLRVQPAAPFETAKLTTELQAALKAADEAYGEAADTVDGADLNANDLAGLRPEKASTKILALYGRAMVGRIAAASGADAELAKKAEDHIKDAKAAADEAVNANSLTLPRLPAEVTVEKKATPPEGTTPAEGTTPEGGTPAEGGATPPADGATPPADGATPAADPGA